MVGNLIDSKNSFKSYPHIKNGAFIKDEQLILYENLYTLNGVGGRGFVLAPYLANILSEFVVNGEEMPKEVLNYRLFKRWAKKEGIITNHKPKRMLPTASIGKRVESSGIFLFAK
jgi:hypothetical protein